MKPSKEISWERQNKQLQEDADSINQLRKEIVILGIYRCFQSKETDMDVSAQQNIGDKIENLKHNATVLAQKLENEKLKNSELETIIKHLKGQMGLDHSYIPAGGESGESSLEDMDKRLKKLEYDLDQINSKSNKTSKKIKEQKDTINMCRTERVIDSVIFRNIEKELKDSQINFKKLLIDRVKHDKEYNKLLEEYSLIKTKASNLQDGSKDKKRPPTNGEEKFLKDAPEINEATLDAGERKFIQIEQPSNRSGAGKNGQIAAQEAQEVVKSKEIIVRKLLVELGLNSGNELLEVLDKIERINDQKFAELNELIDEANEIERYIRESKELKKSNKIHFYENAGEKSSGKKLRGQIQQLQGEIDSVASIIDSQTKQFEMLRIDDNLLELLRLLQLPLESQEANLGPQQLFRSIQNKLSLILPTRGLKNIRSEKQLRSVGGSMKGINLNASKDINPTGGQTGSNTNGSPVHKVEDRLDQLIGKVRRFEESEKVMQKDDFKEEYRKLLKSSSQMVLPKIPVAKRKSHLNKK